MAIRACATPMRTTGIYGDCVPPAGLSPIMWRVEPTAKSRDSGVMIGGHQAGEHPHAGTPAPRPAPAVPPAADLEDAVRAAQGGDEDAFRVVFRDIQPRLLRYLRTLVGDDAEDVAAEAWLQITKNLSSFQGSADGFRGWSATIARHRALDHLRRQSRRPVADLPVEELVDVAGGRDTVAEAFETMSTDAAMGLISRLPRDQAEAVLLRVVMGLDAKSAGKVLGKRSGAVRTAAYRGLRRLAELLADGAPPRSPRPPRPPRPARPARSARPAGPPGPPRSRPPTQ
jgi:RNA polymerase sigma-70 factor (ECF subfamily)